MSAIVLPAAPSSLWRRALSALALLLLAVLLLYRDTAASMVAIWSNSESFAHAWVVPPISAWLVWRKRHALAPMQPQPSLSMLLPMGLAALAWLAGDLASTNAVTQLAFVTLLVFSVPAVLGTEIGRVLLFPLGFLFFAVPIGEFTVPLLMSWTADFTVAALRLSGIPVYREGQQFVIPSGNWSVVEACSGVRYLMASLMVGTLYAYLNYRSLRRRLLFMLMALLLPVLANWLRAYLIVMLGHFTDNRLAAGADHLIYGWVFFGIVILMMFMIGMRWAEIEPAAVLVPAAGRPQAGRHGAGRPVWAVAAAAAALALFPAAALQLIAQGVRAGTPQLQLPEFAAGWTVRERASTDWSPALQEPAARLQARLQRGAAEVGLYIGYHRRQNYRHKLAGSDNVLVRSDDPVWAQVSASPHSLDAGGRRTDWHTAVLRAAPAAGQLDAGRLVVWRAYWIDGRWTASDTEARFRLAAQRLLGRGDDAAVVVVNARQDAGHGAATIEAFLRDNLALIEAELSRVQNATGCAPSPATAGPEGRAARPAGTSDCPSR